MNGRILAGSIMLMAAAAAVWMILDRSSSPPGTTRHREPSSQGTEPASPRPPDQKKKGSSPDAEPTLAAGGLSLPIVFPDGNISPEMKAVIINDLNWVLRFTDQHDRMRPLYRKQLVVQGKSAVPVAHLNFKGPSRSFPKGIIDYAGVIVEVDGGEAMVVPTELVKLYEDAMTLLASHPGSEAQLAEFIKKLNGRAAVEGFGDLLEFHSSAKGMESQLRNMSAADFDRLYRSFHYLRPSILEIVPPDHEAPGAVMVAPLYMEDDSGLRIGPHLVYKEEKWRIFVIR